MSETQNLLKVKMSLLEVQFEAMFMLSLQHFKTQPIFFSQ